ncbi:MFS transporter [Legionella cardiaca]|uniref:MFS transporter n=1 Tax=Legionella cardiaca TaxID=1071983 RepID=A0ABY8AQU4_9GAMM|nr:MFS transporter [Legionella cardiaca]WED42809.1 MFS transporter [Legionella cardiaca]
MIAVMFETFVPLLSLFIFLLGTGFFSTLLGLSMTLNHASPVAIGAMTGIYYAGLVLGSFRVERFITRVGHVAAYSVFSSLLAVIYLLHGIFYHVGLWLFLRLIAGFAAAGLFVVIESWLLCKSTKTNRGQILSLYMIAFYAASSLGQFFLNLGDSHSLLLFVVASMMSSLSLIPLSMSYVSPPKFDEPSTLSLNTLIHISPSGLAGCLSSGLIMGGLYAFMPTYLTDLFHEKAAVAKYMFAIIFGGMLLQYPIGRLSDQVERGTVLIILVTSTIVVSIALMIGKSSSLFLSLMTLFGGLTFTLYPISISHACDVLNEQDIVAGTQSLLLAYSIGAMGGPFIASLYLRSLGSPGLFIYFSSICGAVMPLLILWKGQKASLIKKTSF